MKTNTLETFKFLQTEAQEQGPRGEKEWQPWAGDMTDQLNWHTNQANARIPYMSEVQVGESPAGPPQ